MQYVAGHFRTNLHEVEHFFMLSVFVTCKMNFQSVSGHTFRSLSALLFADKLTRMTLKSGTPPYCTLGQHLSSSGQPSKGRQAGEQ